jgi:hypothetical protein
MAPDSGPPRLAAEILHRYIKQMSGAPLERLLDQRPSLFVDARVLGQTDG